jgi:hypothetical protein
MTKRVWAFGIMAVGLASCATAQMNQQKAVEGKLTTLKAELAMCDSSSGLKEADIPKWGDYGIPPKYDDWNDCRHRALLAFAQGTNDYPRMMEYVAFTDGLVLKIKKHQMTHAEAHVEAEQKFARMMGESQQEAMQLQATQQAQQAQVDQRNSAILMGMSQNLLQQSQPKPSPFQTTNCQRLPGGNMNCTTW